MRLADRIAIVVGAGQGPGEGLGNGRATALLYAREGAKVLAVDIDLKSAQETAAIVTEDGGTCVAFAADVTKEATLKAAVDEAVKRWGRVDILHNNVGLSLAGGDAGPLEITEAAFDRISAINLRGTIMACKHVLPVMRAQRSGAIINISSIAAWATNYPTVAYKATKAAMIAYTAADRHAERRVRHPLQRHPAGPDRHADGGGHARPHLGQDARRGGRRARRPRAAAAEDGQPPGTWPTPRCSWPRTRRASSPAWRCRWTAARACCGNDPPVIPECAPAHIRDPEQLSVRVLGPGFRLARYALGRDDRRRPASSQRLAELGGRSTPLQQEASSQ